MNSQDYLFHCLSVMEADKNLSEQTKVVMFMEFYKKKLEEEGLSEWKPASQNPQQDAVYEVTVLVSNEGVVNNFKRWNGFFWVRESCENIIFWREIKNPHNARKKV